RQLSAHRRCGAVGRQRLRRPPNHRGDPGPARGQARRCLMATKTKLALGFDSQVQTVSLDVPTDEPRPWDADTQLRVVGQGLPRIDGALKVNGKARYTHDIALDDLLHAAVLRCPFPCAVLEQLDVNPALGMPGVEAVLAIAKPGDKLIFAGQDVAAVAARRPEQARAALAAIVAQYKPEAFVTDTRAA